jgi:hypothetical protein
LGQVGRPTARTIETESNVPKVLQDIVIESAKRSSRSLFLIKSDPSYQVRRLER